MATDNQQLTQKQKSQTGADTAAKEPYEAPELVELGKVEELTRGAISGNPQDGGGFFPPPP